MEEYLSETYGVTVYQEQVMLLSQKLAGFTKGEADVLRKAMGKKQADLLHKLKKKFMQGCAKKGYSTKVTEKIWKDWEAFALYAFNKSHAVAYSILSYQTAYFKANYPQEYMAALLSASVQDQDKIKKFLKGCRDMGIEVLPPDVNESNFHFTVNDSGQIRFGMAAIKGIGRGAIAQIVKERDQEGDFESFSDFLNRMDIKILTKKNLEALVSTGSFQSMGYHKAQFFFKSTNHANNFLERSLVSLQKHKTLSQSSRGLFGASEKFSLEEAIPHCPKYGLLQDLLLEKEYLGRFVSSHPSDMYAYLSQHKAYNTLDYIESILREKPHDQKSKSFWVMGIVEELNFSKTQRDQSKVSFFLDSSEGRIRIYAFGENSDKLKVKLRDNQVYFVEIEIKNMVSNPLILAKKVCSIDEFIAQNFKELEIQLNLNNIDETLIDSMSEIFLKNKGCKILTFNIFASDEKTDLDFFSAHSINISHLILSHLRDKGVQFSLR